MTYIALIIATINWKNLFMLHFGLTGYARPYEVLSCLLRLLFNMKGKPLGPTLNCSIFSLIIVRLTICIGLLNPGVTVSKQEYLRNVYIFDNKLLNDCLEHFCLFWSLFMIPIFIFMRKTALSKTPSIKNNERKKKKKTLLQYNLCYSVHAMENFYRSLWPLKSPTLL